MKMFGTDGIRARAGDFPLNGRAIVAIGQALAERLGGEILVGQDTRVSSPWIFDLLKEGFARYGKAVIENAGVLPTPAVALLTRRNSFAGGIMISASHNPFDDNGIKVFSSDGTKLKDDMEAEVEERVHALLPAGAASERDEVPDAAISKNGSDRWVDGYCDLLRAHFQTGEWLRGMRIMADCANGAMSVVAPRVLKRLGADVQVVCGEPTGRNINLRCGAVHLEALTEAMKEGDADFGVAFDGDGDRSLFVSRSGRQVDGDAVLLMMARRLRPARVVGTSMTNYALEKMLAAEGIALTRVGVGDRYIFEEMQRSGADAVLGGEPSGHIIFSDFGLSGDGLLTALKVAEAMVETRKSLDDLTADWVPAPQILKGVRVSRRVPLEELNTLQAVMRDASAVLENCGRLVVRYSGTEPLLRVMIESDDATRNEEWMQRLLRAIEKDLPLAEKN
jgi:phosphoglucosamine mutase